LRRYDIISTLVLMGLSVYVVSMGFTLGYGQWSEPGPGFIAVLAGLLLFGLSAAWLIPALLRRADAARRFFPEPGSARKVALIVVAMAGFTLLLDRAGFLLTSLGFMLFLLRAIEPQRWRTTILLASLTAVICLLVFQIWLQVQLPEGPISVYALTRAIHNLFVNRPG